MPNIWIKVHSNGADIVQVDMFKLVHVQCIYKQKHNTAHTN